MILQFGRPRAERMHGGDHAEGAGRHRRHPSVGGGPLGPFGSPVAYGALRQADLVLALGHG